MLKDVLTSITDKLSGKFTIDINSSDITEGFERPSFFIDFENITKKDYLNYSQRSFKVRIYYFPTDKYDYQIEVLEKREAIEALFNIGFYVGDRYLTITDSIESDVVDGVLQVTFDISYSLDNDVDFDKGSDELMGDLNVRD